MHTLFRSGIRLRNGVIFSLQSFLTNSLLMVHSALMWTSEEVNSFNEIERGRKEGGEKLFLIIH